jgi:TATA-box binding protein (TBP) (component of TFIID and TFIIIB)
MNKLKIDISNTLKQNKLNEDVCISTITFTCKLKNAVFDCENIAKYIDLSNDDIFCVSCKTKNDTIIERTLINNKNKNKSYFHNLILIKTKIPNNDNILIKLFSDGNIRITGCKSETDIYNAIILIIDKLKNNANANTFVSNIKYLDVVYIDNLLVNMINATFKNNQNINLEKLYSSLLAQNIDCRYDKLSHACVNIKYKNNEKIISIFVFQKGSIVITGAKNFEQISNAQNYITNLIYNFNNKIENEKKDNSNTNNTKKIQNDNIVINSDTVIHI